MVGFVEVGLADVVDSLDDVVVGLLLGGTVKFWHDGFWKNHTQLNMAWLFLWQCYKKIQLLFIQVTGKYSLSFEEVCLSVLPNK